MTDFKGTPVSVPRAAGGTVSARLHTSPGAPARACVALAHGANNGMDNDLLVHAAAGLADRGFTALRFNFPYRDAGRKSPDSQKVLEATWADVARHCRENLPGGGTLVATGKSMGGRVASQMAAEGALEAAALVFLGYPLHALGKKDTPRWEHLARVQAPMLFFAGTRDPLCSLDVLESVLPRLAAPWHLETIEGGDHSLAPRTGQGAPPEEVYAGIVEKTTAWLARVLPSA